MLTVTWLLQSTLLPFVGRQAMPQMRHNLIDRARDTMSVRARDSRFRQGCWSPSVRKRFLGAGSISRTGRHRHTDYSKCTTQFFVIYLMLTDVV
jgi:hypothetical protein